MDLEVLVRNFLVGVLIGLGIAYTFKTWLASLILGILICGRETSKK